VFIVNNCKNWLSLIKTYFRKGIAVIEKEKIRASAIVEALGGALAVSKMLAAMGVKVSRMAVWQWTERNEIPLGRLVLLAGALERSTGLRRWDIVPEHWETIWPELVYEKKKADKKK
jgi:hypothetical protein